MSRPSRSVLHVDLDAFFVSVERRADPSLRGKPVIIGGGPASGVVAAASSEARAAGVVAGQPLAGAQRICPEAVTREGDFDGYARASEEVTAILLGASRRVERPSIDEAYVELTREAPTEPLPVGLAERLKDEIQDQLGFDASFGVAGSRLGARVASGLARPRGLLIVLPGYERSFLSAQPITVLTDLPSQAERALRANGLTRLGDLTGADEGALAAIVGRAMAARLVESIAGTDESPVAVVAAPTWLQEESRIRDSHADPTALGRMLQDLAQRASRRLRPFGLAAETLTVEVERGAATDRRSLTFERPLSSGDALGSAAWALAEPLLDPAGSVKALVLRLSRLRGASKQAPLFPLPGEPGRRAALL